MSGDSDGASEFEGVAFETIEAAVRETARGRWFLQEYARRVHARAMSRIEEALARIEERLPLEAGLADEADTCVAALSIYQRLVDLAGALRERGVDDESCARIEAQANALIELARRRNLSEAADMLEEGLTTLRATPAA